MGTLVAVGALAVPGLALGIAGPTQFRYTGGEQAYQVPAGVEVLSAVVQGAWGGAWGGGAGHYTPALGQAGAAWQGLVPVTPGQTLYAEVGQNGTIINATSPTFGGGGPGGVADPDGDESPSGGGASDIRTCSELGCAGGVAGSTASRLIVAGGAGGNGGSATTDGAGLVCRPGVTGGGQAVNAQPLPGGNASQGPLPIITPAGIVIPGDASGDDFTTQTINGETDAAGGSNAPGAGGSGTVCGAGTATQFSDIVAGASASGPDGGAGGDAAGLAPYSGPLCNPANGPCSDAGPGGGGGGGYFGGGGGATGFDVCKTSTGTCNNVDSSQGGGAGSSFIASGVEDPTDVTQGVEGTGVPFISIAPVVEIDSPANGAVYSRGQIVDASWACSDVPGWGNGLENCTGTVASGGPIDTSPGTHAFTVSGVGLASHPISVTVHYTVATGGGGGGGGTQTAHGSLAGWHFALSVATACLARDARLAVDLTRTGSGNGYRMQSLSYYIGRGTTHRKHLVIHGKRRTILVYGPTLVSGHAGMVDLPIGGSKVGTHTLKLVITLVLTKHHGTPKHKTLTLTLPFTVC